MRKTTRDTVIKIKNKRNKKRSKLQRMLLPLRRKI